MSQKPKTTVEVLAGLVDEDVAHQHLPGWESFQIIALLPVLVLVMFLVVYTAFMAPANLYAFLAAFHRVHRNPYVIYPRCRAPP